MNSEIKVSVCIISYNQEKYIDECLDSITCQKGSFHLEIVIRDDFSTDSTYEKITNNLSKINNKKITIKILEAKDNLGANRNILEVLKNCTGEYVAFCEGDDYWCDELKLQKQLNAAEKNTEVDFFVHPAYFDKNGLLEKAVWPINKKYKFIHSEILMNEWQFAPTASYFICAKALNKIPVWFERATIGDIYIEVYSGENGVFVIDEYMSVYRVNAEGSWTKKNSGSSSSVQKKVIKHFKNANECMDLIEKDFPFIKESIVFRKNIHYFQLLRAFVVVKDVENVRFVRNDIKNSGYPLSAKQKIKYFLSYSFSVYSKIIKLAR